MNVAIVNCRVGNVRSVVNAVTALGASATLTDNPDELMCASQVILPGVGAFHEGMAFLRERKLVESLQQFAATGKPLLGICLGFQLLCHDSNENGFCKGLGILDAVVRRIPDHNLRLPHIGWNDVTLKQTEPFAGLEDAPCFYFAHSYHVITHNEASVSATVDYGCNLVAAVKEGNITGTQFHPEKSHRNGLRVLDNFLHPGRRECDDTIDTILKNALSDDRLVRGDSVC